ncbi:MAG: hypothetical protein AB7L36_16680 [Sphingomonadaceae bacterium]
MRLPSVDAHDSDVLLAQAQRDSRGYSARLDRRAIDRVIPLQRSGNHLQRAVDARGDLALIGFDARVPPHDVASPAR